MISNFSSSLFNLGIILIVFSAIVYIIKTKLTEMDKKISSLSSVVESVVSVLNDSKKNNTSGNDINLEKTLVSDDEDDEDEDINSDSDTDDDEDDENDENYKRKSDIKEILDDDGMKLNEVELLRADVDPEKSILGMNFETYDSIDDNMEAQKHAEQFSNSNLEAGVFSNNDQEKHKDSKDLHHSSMTVKELKKIVSEKGGKVSELDIDLFIFLSFIKSSAPEPRLLLGNSSNLMLILDVSFNPIFKTSASVIMNY